MHNFLNKIALCLVPIALAFAPCANSQTVARLTISSSNDLAQALSNELPTTASIEQVVHEQINQYRAEHGFPAITIDSSISEQARLHSQNMANGTIGFGHDGFQERLGAISITISYTSAAENVAYNQGYGDPATQAVKGWLNSNGHLKNIRGNYNQTGIGVAKNASDEYYFTQIFIRTP